MSKSHHPVPEGFHTITPQLTIEGAAEAIDWYKKALGAVERSRSAGPDGKIMHADIQIGDSHIMLNDAIMGGKGPKAFGGSPASLWVYMADADAHFDRALHAGGQAVPGPMGQMSDQFWGDRCASFTDPFGYRWTIASHKEDLTRDEMEHRQAEFMKQFAKP